jgi:SAM-dependent methyltransferase
MRPDVSELWDFYAGRLGRLTRQRVQRQINHFWPDTKGQSVLGMGYAVPYLSPYLDDAERVVALMPATQGVMHWPAHHDRQHGRGGGLVTLSPDYELPFEDNCFDRIMLVHGLEHAGQSRRLLREAWRVMSSGGRLLIIAPNRASPWAFMERTPFGHGHPYSQSQLSRLLRDNMFQPLHRRGALFLPPWRSRLLLRATGPMEQLGGRFNFGLPGVHLVEAEKQIYAATAIPARQLRVSKPATAGGKETLSVKPTTLADKDDPRGL